MNDVKAHTKAETFTKMFQFQEGIYNNAFSDLTDEVALERPSKRSNHMNWLLGHILHCRFMLGNMIGIEAKNPFGNVYWDAIEDSAYPSIKEMLAEFPQISKKLEERLSHMTDDELNSKPNPDRPAPAELVSFFVYHEAYHLGQLGYARKIIGMEPLKSH